MAVGRQQQFLDVLDCDEARRRFEAAIRLEPLGEETIPAASAWGRILSRDVVATVDVPAFDRSNVDGFAIRAADVIGASEEQPRRLRLLGEVLATGVAPTQTIESNCAVEIATGGMLPRGADAVVMVEQTDARDGELLVFKSAPAGSGISFAGADIACGETVLRRGERLTSRETGVLAAIGVDRVRVWRRVRVAILSTGDELIPPGAQAKPACVFDSNGPMLTDAVRELDAEPAPLGIVPDDLALLRERLSFALREADVVLLSGGTSKGGGDVSYRAVGELTDPGVIAHGVALKPGKPICLAATGGKPVVVLPGFPTSAIFTFHEFVAPVLRALAGAPRHVASRVSAGLAMKTASEAGRTEYLLVGLVPAPTLESHASGVEQADVANRSHSPTGAAAKPALIAYPMGKGSGSITTFSKADGFVTFDKHVELVDAGTPIEAQLLGRDLRLADLVVIGSHCIGLDWLMSQLQERGWRTKLVAVGSSGGLEAAKRGECDLAGMHLLDAATGEYNRPFLTPSLMLVAGYRRLQGIVFRPNDQRFEGRLPVEAVAVGVADPDCIMVNRNQGSGTRLLIERLLAGAQPRGYSSQPSSHHAVAAAVKQGRADWGVTIENVAKAAGLGFLPLAEESFDFAVPRERWERPAVVAFRELLAKPATRAQLAALGLR